MSIFDLFDDNFVNIFWIAISGFIINTLVSQKLLLFNNPDRDIIRIITFGCVNLIFGETVKKIFTIIIKDNNVNWLNGLFPFIFNILIPILVISPSIIIVYEHIKYSEVFNFFGLDPVSKSDVWTILANEMKQNKHVSITLKNGKKINGFFDKKSFVSFLNDKDRSVYLSCVYDKENNNIVGRSIYVNGEEISHIALHDKDENQEMNKNQKKKGGTKMNDKKNKQVDEDKKIGSNLEFEPEIIKKSVSGIYDKPSDNEKKPNFNDEEN